ncbi:hypothetical protein PFISCL1PPCAC_19439 [Pristionchus fissidentatus]|uniref:Transcription factor CBF/NF-Y/archaeal histone domain-containing protein n=1 Tax=Pristionchus fissidentatus TaxID=1538716 RepID=A0AAV5WAZ7_9BILA|nr:hypothetical protein PFISCL1PPCAC_19439 [Pristionchus fissidentatus]
MYSGGQPSTSSHHHSDQSSFYPHTSANVHGQLPSTSHDASLDSSMPGPSSSSPQYIEMLPMRASNGSGLNYGSGGNHDFPMDINPIEETVEMEEEMPCTSRQKEGTSATMKPFPDQATKPANHKPKVFKVEGYDMKKMIRNFWPMQKKRVENMSTKYLREASRNQVLPLARVKKIMKIDENVQKQMIAADAPLLLSVASEMFIEELTLRSWEVTEEAKRKTLQKVDVATASVRHDHMDFLIDIIPRTGIIPRPKESPKAGLGQAQIVQIVRDGLSMEGNKFVLKGGNTLIADPGASSSIPHEFSARLESGEEAQVIQIGKPIPLSSQAMTQLGLANFPPLAPPPSSSHSNPPSSHSLPPSIRLVSRDAPPHRSMKMMQKRSTIGGQGQGEMGGEGTSTSRTGHNGQ